MSFTVKIRSCRGRDAKGCVINTDCVRLRQTNPEEARVPKPPSLPALPADAGLL